MTAEQRLAARMTTAEKLATAVAAGTAGFRSAGSHMQELKQNRLNREAEKERAEKRAKHDAMLAKSAAAAAAAAKLVVAEKKPAVVARSNKRPVGQGSLMSYFAPKPPLKEKTATEVIKQAKKQGLSLKEQIQALPQPRLPVKPDHGGVVLLSSSPVRVGASSPVSCRRAEEVGMNRVSSVAVEASVSRVTIGGYSLATAGISRSVTVQAAGTAAGTAKKRTLGIRRSMNGWQNRASAKKE